jgi:hypothetical protein
MMADGAAVGPAAAVTGAVLGLGAWFAYVPSLQTDAASGPVLASAAASLRPATAAQGR